MVRSLATMSSPDVPGLDDAPFVVDWLESLVDRDRAAATVAGYRRDVRAVGAHLAVATGRPAHELRPRDLTGPALRAAFRAWTRDPPARRRRSRHDPGTRSVASRRRAWAAWNALCGWLVREQRLAGNPMAAVPRPAREALLPRDIDVPDPLPRLFAAAATPVTDARETRWPARDVALVATIAFAGLRVGEAVGMDRRDLVRGEEPRVHVLGKGRRHRAVPTLPAVVARIDDYLVEREQRHGTLPPPGGSDETDDQRALWVHVRTGRRVTRAQVEHLVERLYVRAGIAGAVPEGTRVHALRHHAAHTWLANGAKVTEVQALLGHASLDTTQRYVAARGGDLRDAVRANPAIAALTAVPNGGTTPPSDATPAHDRPTTG